MARKIQGYSSFDFQRYLLIMVIGIALLLSLAACSNASGQNPGELESLSGYELSFMEESVEEDPRTTNDTEEKTKSQNPTAQSPTGYKTNLPRRIPPASVENLASLDTSHDFDNAREYTVAMLEAGWVAFEAEHYVPPAGATLIKMKKLSPKGQEQRRLNSRSVKTEFSSVIFFLPPDESPQTWGQSRDI